MFLFGIITKTMMIMLIISRHRTVAMKGPWAASRVIMNTTEGAG